MHFTANCAEVERWGGGVHLIFVLNMVTVAARRRNKSVGYQAI